MKENSLAKWLQETPQVISGWTIGVCRVRDKWVVELWDGTSLHATVDSPIAAARLHREIVAGANSNTRDDVDDQHEISS
ncbi:hypothetical protein E2P84_44365 [Burkholderia cepacia]|uniref:Uncharacterized protein n=1 Tax=Burkholderia cepacia TaxID=292 RepID=A0AAX2RLX7_BURCE|nr:hypothetical protein E2P84_44365 [Burkholderia cepacia]TET00340.1 hypothetical protein E3D36_22010 [Burkholderia cepacia]TEU34832.1 hypothetical protein E3D38_42920 [Burkholderia cepacia]TEU36808.1 hypothetical protein E3D39_26515 [Burkholderia cepacia]TEU42887.1 hypothetical protein E3D37_24220 [Burkholderia cepacia]